MRGGSVGIGVSGACWGMPGKLLPGGMPRKPLVAGVPGRLLGTGMPEKLLYLCCGIDGTSFDKACALAAAIIGTIRIAMRTKMGISSKNQKCKPNIATTRLEPMIAKVVST